MEYFDNKCKPYHLKEKVCYDKYENEKFHENNGDNYESEVNDNYNEERD